MSVTAIPFTFDAKAVVTEAEKGDLLIEGWAIRTDEIDREGERWSDTSEALWRSVRRFVDDNGPLAFHHRSDTIGIGRVLDAERVPGVGIKVKAMIAYQEPETKWRHIYEAARRGLLSRFSFQGIFKRRQTAKGPVLEDADFVELSICGSSVGHGTTWSLLQEKALSAPSGKAITADGHLVDAAADRELRAIRDQLEGLRAEAAALRMTQLHEEKKSVVNPSSLYRYSQTHADPLGTAEASRYVPTDEDRNRVRAADIHRQRQTKDGVINERAFELDLAAALRGDPETLPLDAFDQRLRVDASKGYLTGEETARALGAKPVSPDPGPSPNDFFDAQEAVERESVTGRLARRLAQLQGGEDR